MKLLSKEEEQAHYGATVKGGLIGGFSGLGLGAAGVLGASRRYPIVRHLTLPMKVFLVTSAGTFGAIVYADRASRSFEMSRYPGQQYVGQAERQRKQIQAQQPLLERSKDWARENRYAIIGGSWAASMAIALGIVGRNPYQSTAQKLVQARVYAQGLTVLVLLATAALEIGNRGSDDGRWETVKVADPKDPEHKRKVYKKVYHENYVGENQWQDMVEAEEHRIKGRTKVTPSHESHEAAKARHIAKKQRQGRESHEDHPKSTRQSPKAALERSSSEKE